MNTIAIVVSLLALLLALFIYVRQGNNAIFTDSVERLRKDLTIEVLDEELEPSLNISFSNSFIVVGYKHSKLPNGYVQQFPAHFVNAIGSTSYLLAINDVRNSAGEFFLKQYREKK
nr:MAG TPA: hypothetical protein [Bacteriophage sp.]